MSVIALDPGNSTGWCFRTNDGKLIGGTIGENHKDVWDLLCKCNPDVVVYETFQMYPGKAQKLIWNTFYPCEVIGVIKAWVNLHPEKMYVVEPEREERIPVSRTLIGLQPSVKKFALSNSELELWKTVECEHATEHMRDAVRLLRYYERHYSK